MSKVFLYFLGAGASCQVLPLAADFSMRLKAFTPGLQYAGYDDAEIGKALITSQGFKWGEIHQRLYEDFEWLASESSHHFSIDTLAKKLFFKGDLKNLKRLKAILSVYLLIEQSKSNADQRYDAFLASIMELDENRRIRLPKQLRILTWNYDTQLEKAFYGFCENIEHTLENITFNNDAIYRINGYCGTPEPGHIGGAFRDFLNSKNSPTWETGVQLYSEYVKSSNVPDINFAWEDQTQTKLKNRLSAILADVTDIVVIGYSFPYFNREVDDLIFSQLSHLNNIYLQMPDKAQTSITDRIEKLLPPHDKIVPITSTDLFFIPDDF